MLLFLRNQQNCQSVFNADMLKGMTKRCWSSDIALYFLSVYCSSCMLHWDLRLRTLFKKLVPVSRRVGTHLLHFVTTFHGLGRSYLSPSKEQSGQQYYFLLPTTAVVQKQAGIDKVAIDLRSGYSHPF